jgi:signal peptide peptidase SppA
MKRVITYIETSFWACRAQEFDSLCRIAYRESDGLDAILEAAEFDENDNSNIKFDAMLAKKGERLNGTRYVEIRENGVAVIDVNGVIAKRMGFFAEICYGGTSTETLLKDFQTALSSPNVSSIIFHIDSPGGEAFGINELAQAIYDARGTKPIKAYVSGLGCSGAYWIASACDEIIADRSAFLGSIGVVTSWTDDTGFYKMMGIRREVVTSTNAPFKRLNIDIDEHRAELMRELDSLENVFHKAVARNRKVTIEQVKKDFNQGGVLNGIDAVKVKMADRTSSLEEVVQKLARKGKSNALTGAENTGEINMSFKDDFKTFAVKHGLMSADGNEPQPAASGANEPPQTAAEYGAAAIRANNAERELADLKAEREQERQKQIKTDAENFVADEIKAGRMLPAENKEGEFVSLYIQAAADDAASPLVTGSRLDNLKTIQSKRKTHGLTEESLDPKTGLKILPSEDNPTAELERAAETQAADYVGTITPKLRVVKQ